MDDANKMIHKALSKFIKQPQLQKQKESYCRIVQGESHLQDMMTGIRHDLNNKKPASDYYDLSIEMYNNRKKLSKVEDDFFYKLAGVMLIKSDLYNIDPGDCIEFWYRESGVHICNITITVSLFRNEKFRHRKYWKLLDTLSSLKRLI